MSTNEFLYISSLDNHFPDYECRLLFEKYKSSIYPDIEYSFDAFLSDTGGFLYAVYVDNELGGFIWLHDFSKDCDYCYLSGFSYRKKTPFVKEAVINILDHVQKRFGISEIKCETDLRHAVLCLLRIGFKKIDKNIYSLKGGC